MCTEASKDTKTATKDVGKKTPTKSKFRDNRVTAADMMMQQYRSSKTGSVTVGPSALRAYYVWYSNDNLTPNDIARLLREPPLQTNTVVSYILDAVAGERMPYCKDRMKTELLSTLSPTAVKIARYQTLMSSCED